MQLELIAAARRHQRIPYVLAPDAGAMFAELDAGHPVLVLQDLGVGPLHVWHYAVVIGYEDEPQQVVLRSGTTERLEKILFFPGTRIPRKCRLYGSG